MKKWRIVLLLVILVGVIIIIKSDRNSITDLSQIQNINIRAFSITDDMFVDYAISDAEVIQDICDTFSNLKLKKDKIYKPYEVSYCLQFYDSNGVKVEGVSVVAGYNSFFYSSNDELYEIRSDVNIHDYLTTIISGLESSLPEKTSEDKVDNNKVLQYLIQEYDLAASETPPKVILDCDMTYLGDDAMCMCILVQADAIGLIDLLGVTITGGNKFVAYGANSALNQLERIGRADIPVYLGTDIPINGVRNLEEQSKIVGRIDRWGALYHFDEYIEPEQYHNLGSYYERKWGYSQNNVMEQSAIDFMIEQVDKYKGEVTMIAVGAATNVAMACQKDEQFAGNTAGIIYMGTVIEEEGSYTPYADFNCFYDAESYEICLNSAFPKQIIIPHDAAKTAVLNKAVFDLMDAKADTLVSKFWLDGQYSLYQRDVNRTSNCSDAIAAVVFLNPKVVSEQRKVAIQINTDVSSPEYGRATITEEAGDIAVLMAVDTALYWEFATDVICEMQE